ncbi:transcriptional regulatory protein [Collibacillus ludicampi]|uniref:Transcriptional regulatory protein n=1 Tax=Collibacillus ludicampi TaxID=2771369 RepID=A0AAV4LBZ1_9BACL|nr:response regulator [Collibacillus ludicampi]GIM45308.1 transcriptional regulatory protein [Collibacillus ludicampi]
MTSRPIRVAVVDDDFMIANLHAKFVHAQKGYEVIGTAYNYEQTLSLITRSKPDLLILDVYMPDRSGIDLLHTLRTQKIACDVILITAAKENDIVEEGFRLGIFDYLIKPFDFDQLKKSLHKYAQFRSRLTSVSHLDQETLDELKKLRAIEGTSTKLPPSGIDLKTLERIRKCLQQAEGPQSAQTIAERAGVSRSTARTYLVYLVEENIAEEELLYGSVGRPQRLYRLKNQPTA